jgi:hypothetical protein
VYVNALGIAAEDEVLGEWNRSLWRAVLAYDEHQIGCLVDDDSRLKSQQKDPGRTDADHISGNDGPRLGEDAIVDGRPVPGVEIGNEDLPVLEREPRVFT